MIAYDQLFKHREGNIILANNNGKNYVIVDVAGSKWQKCTEQTTRVCGGNMEVSANEVSRRDTNNY